MKILLIQNYQTENFVHIESYLINNKIEHILFKAFNEPKFPRLKEFSHIIIGGSPQSVNEIDNYSFLKEEWKYLEKAIQLNKPIFGLCFGAQIIARILGAKVRENAIMEIGDYEVQLSEAGKDDLFFQNFPDKFHTYQWHGDTFDIPEGAELLVQGKDCKNQAYRYKNILAVQFHLELDHFEVKNWCTEFSDSLKGFHKTPKQLVEECIRIEQSQLELSNLLLDNFFKS